MDPTAPSLIAEVMPRHAVRQVDRVAVAAEPSEAYAAARDVDLSRIPFVRRLFALRLLPERLAARIAGRPRDATATMRIDDIARGGSGFLVVREQKGREVVVGSVGKFWQPAIEFARVTPEQYLSFDSPGYGKLAWCLRVDPRAGGGSWLTVEVRVDATDAGSLRRFKRYWRLIGPFSHAIRHGALRMLEGDLGPAPDDATRPLAGDDLIPRARLQKTHATTIEAKVEDVWPWLLQMGAGRAGWYSFDFLDNGRVPSADRIVPELQSLKIGDVIPALPDTPGGFAVLSLVPSRCLVLGDPSLAPGGTRPEGAPPWKSTWAFELEPIGGAATRLLVRVRADYRPALKMAVVRPAIMLAHEIMERRQLHNLRRRAEAR
jgi:hypothetical protein